VNEKSFEDQRKNLVEYLSGIAIRSDNIKKAFLQIKRENFVPQKMRQFSYEDSPLPLGEGQTISQPQTIALMLELLNAKEAMKVLEIGSGSGYVLALLSKIVGKSGSVYGVEIDQKLAEISKNNLAIEGIKNAHITLGDGAFGWAQNAPYDRILISCACPFIPKELFNELSEDGRIIAPVGDSAMQIMEIMVKKNGAPIKKTVEGEIFTFVPMKGKLDF